MADFDPTYWCERALALGAEHALLIDPEKVVTAEWVRMKCLFGCDEPGLHRTCPPRSPEPKHTRRLLDGFARAVLLRVGPHTSAEGMDGLCTKLNAAAVALERELFLAGYHKTWTMGAGPCELCGTCALDGDCVHPLDARPSMEGCGVDVFSTVRNAGWQIEVVREHDDEYQYFALVLVE